MDRNIKKVILVVIGLTLLSLCSTCKKEDVASVNQLVKDLFCFKTGSEWTYYDSVNDTTAVMHIFEYTQHYLVYPIPPGGHLGGERISIDGFFLSDFTLIIKTEDEGKKYDKTAVVTGRHTFQNDRNTTTFLTFQCDKKNNFDCPIAYLAEYDVNSTTYRDVYVIEQKNIQYYFAKHIGLIRMVKDDDYDWVLINKNVQQ